MFVTNDADFFDRAHYYWDHCRDKTKVLFNNGIGFKYKMPNIVAALGLAQLERAGEIIEKRRQIFFWYKERLGGIKGLSMNIERPGAYNNFYVPTIILEKDFGISPQELMRKMESEGVKNRPFFRCISKFPMFKPVKAPNADWLAARGINLPCATVLTEDDIDYSAEVIKKYLAPSLKLRRNSKKSVIAECKAAK
jgi:perosamine synthetase